jgi:hypothetical protein
MTLTFHAQSGVVGNQRGELQVWIEESVDKDNDFYINAHGTTNGNYVVLRRNWHKSAEDPNEHLTALIYVVSNNSCSDMRGSVPNLFLQNGQHNSTAHVSRTGQVTLFSQGMSEFNEFAN